MVMLRPKGKPQKIAEAVMKKKGIKTPPSGAEQRIPLKQPLLQH